MRRVGVLVGLLQQQQQALASRLTRADCIASPWAIAFVSNLSAARREHAADLARSITGKQQQLLLDLVTS